MNLVERDQCWFDWQGAQSPLPAAVVCVAVLLFPHVDYPRINAAVRQAVACHYVAASSLFLLLRWGSWPTTQSFDHAKLLGGTGGSKLETYF